MKGIHQNNIDIDKVNERKQMIKQVLDKLWNGQHKVNNKLDGYWYVRLSDVSKVLEGVVEVEDIYKQEESFPQAETDDKE